MEGRVHDEYDAIETPIGLIPKYEDLKILFQQIFGRDYSQTEYDEQFSLKLTGLLERIERIEKIYAGEEAIPEEFFEHLSQQKNRLLQARARFGKELVSPEEFVK
jgi:phosphoenolpyruvate carboxykinase (GTP)